MLGALNPYSRLATLEGIIRDTAPHVKLTGIVSTGTLAYSFVSYITLAIQIYYEHPEFPLEPIFNIITLVHQTIQGTDFYPPAKTHLLDIITAAIILGSELLPASTETDSLLGLLPTHPVDGDPQ